MCFNSHCNDTIYGIRHINIKKKYIPEPQTQLNRQIVGTTEVQYNREHA